MSKQPSIDEAARRLRAEWAESDDWDKLEEDTRNVWRDISRLARKLFAQPEAKKTRPKRPKPRVCEACGLPGDDDCQVEAHDVDGTQAALCYPCFWYFANPRLKNIMALRRRERAELARAKAAAKKARK